MNFVSASEGSWSDALALGDTTVLLLCPGAPGCTTDGPPEACWHNAVTPPANVTRTSTAENIEIMRHSSPPFRDFSERQVNAGDRSLCASRTVKILRLKFIYVSGPGFAAYLFRN